MFVRWLDEVGWTRFLVVWNLCRRFLFFTGGKSTAEVSKASSETSEGSSVISEGCFFSYSISKACDERKNRLLKFRQNLLKPRKNLLKSRKNLPSSRKNFLKLWQRNSSPGSGKGLAVFPHDNRFRTLMSPLERWVRGRGNATILIFLFSDCSSVC